MSVTMSPKWIFFITFIYSRCVAQTPSLVDGIVFAGSTIAPPPTPTQANCRCVAQGTCTSMNIDVRIVNQGTPASCAVGQVWCCGPVAVVNPTVACGTVRLNSPAQPPGTARYGAYPWQVAILTPTNNYLGSGVLINTNHIVTAAHKVAAYATTRAFKVRMGDWAGQNLTETYPYQESTPLRVFVHPMFNPTNLQNDIAVVRINPAASLANSPNINTVCLPTAVPATGQRCRVAGWGKNAFGAIGAYQNVLKEVDVPIVDQGICETRLRSTRLGGFYALDRMSFICAGGEVGKDACTGDGGAPLVCPTSTGQWQVIGLVAWGIGCATPEIPGVYVNVFNYLPWVNQQIATQ